MSKTLSVLQEVLIIREKGGKPILMKPFDITEAKLGVINLFWVKTRLPTRRAV